MSRTLCNYYRGDYDEGGEPMEEELEAEEGEGAEGVGRCKVTQAYRKHLASHKLRS